MPGRGSRVCSLVEQGPLPQTPRMQRREGPRRLVAILFTDIVGSTEIATEVGDARWRPILARHHAIVRDRLKRAGGHLEDTAGDGVFASFASPADAIRCAASLIDAIRAIGIEIRAGVHFGEVETVGGKLAGIGVHTGARVMSAAGAGEVLVSASTRDLVAGGPFTFVDRGEHHLKGLDEPVRLYALSAVNGEPLGQPLDTEEARRRRDAVVAVGSHRGRWIAAAVAAVLVIAAAAVLFTTGKDHPAAASRGGPVLLRVDPTSRDVTTIAHLDTLDVECGTFDPVLAVGADKVWAGFHPGLMSVDPATGGRGPTIAIPRADACSFGFTHAREWKLWLATDHRFSEIDPSDGGTVHSATLEPFAGVGIPHVDLAISDGALWVAGNHDIVEIDPETFHQTDHRLAISVDLIEFGDGALFGLDQIGGYLYRLNPVNLAVEKRVNVSVDLPVLRVGEGSVWLLDAQTGVLQRFAEDDLRALGSTTTAPGTGEMAIGLGAVWLPSANGTLYRFDTTTGETGSIRIGVPLEDVAVDPTFGPDGTVYVTAEYAPPPNSG